MEKIERVSADGCAIVVNEEETIAPRCYRDSEEITGTIGRSGCGERIDRGSVDLRATLSDLDRVAIKTV